MGWIPTLNDRRGRSISVLSRHRPQTLRAGSVSRPATADTPALWQSAGVDLTTVTRAYAEARRCGLTEARVGQGAFVAESMAQVRHATRPRDEFDPSGLSGPDAKYAASAGGTPCCAAGLNRSPS